MRKIISWFLILIILASVGRILHAYFLVHPISIYTKETEHDVTIFFPNITKDPNRTACEHVFPVKRKILASETSLPRHIIEALVDGPTEQEKREGYYPVFPLGTKFLYFAITHDKTEIVIDYDGTLVDSCGDKQIVAQLQETVNKLALPPIELNPDYLLEIHYIRSR